jgi:hypothetical protein
LAKHANCVFLLFAYLAIFFYENIFNIFLVSLKIEKVSEIHRLNQTRCQKRLGTRLSLSMETRALIQWAVVGGATR